MDFTFAEELSAWSAKPIGSTMVQRLFHDGTNLCPPYNALTSLDTSYFRDREFVFGLSFYLFPKFLF